MPEQTPADWLKTLPAWDKTHRIENWLHTYLGVGVFGSQLYSRAFFIGLIGRALNPGFSFPYCLVIEGQQGCGKSRALEILAGDWYGNTDFDLTNRNSFSAFKDKWIYEFAELGCITKAEKHLQKSFLERTFDEYRPLYSHRTVRLPRQTVFVGTTNYLDFIDNPIDGRRFWPVHCGNIKLDALADDREQLFAEALFEFEADPHPLSCLSAAYTPTTEPIKASACSGVAFCPNCRQAINQQGSSESATATIADSSSGSFPDSSTRFIQPDSSDDALSRENTSGSSVSMLDPSI